MFKSEHMWGGHVQRKGSFFLIHDVCELSSAVL